MYRYLISIIEMCSGWDLFSPFLFLTSSSFGASGGKFDRAACPESVSYCLIFVLYCSPEALDQSADDFSAVWISVNDFKFVRIVLNENDVYNAYTGEYTHAKKYAKILFLANDTLIRAFFAGDRD